jgi:hypothetical protein
MTPLAHLIAKQLTLPMRKRVVGDNANLMHKMDDVHCFDVSGVSAAINNLSRRILAGESIGLLAFLPARKTWIETGHRGDGARIGWLLIQNDRDSAADVFMALNYTIMADGSVMRFPGSQFISQYRVPLPLGTTAPSFEVPFAYDRAMTGIQDINNHCQLYATLALINSPKIVGRRQHMPHAGLERKLTRAIGMTGKFPLHAWTEILLDIGEPRDTSDNPSVEAHLTGHRCLHFCRAHVRVRRERLEVVRGHWRGDASLGIKRSRYQVRKST